jgi:hypothetical protein
MMHDKPDREYIFNCHSAAATVIRASLQRIRKVVGIVTVVYLMMPVAALSQVNNLAYADYLLVGQFGEICTMCEAIVICDISDSEIPLSTIPADGNFTLYHFQTRTFWSQIATIWEWFITNFDSDSLAESGHRRPVRVYTVTDGRWSEASTVEAHLSLEPATIDIGDDRIDRIESRWLKGQKKEPVGFCQRLPLWDSLEIIESHFSAEDAG